ncbi:MAG: DUF4429 domain-containing protein [Bacillota bacterium]
MQANGINGQLEVSGSKIVIRRKGIMSKLTQGIKGDKEILIKQITSIQFKPGGNLTNGFIQFAFSGGKENKGGIMDAVHDENTIMFKKKQNPEFEAIKQAIEEKINELNSPVIQQAAAALDLADQIKKLADLRDSGILTEDEFNAKKKQLLEL